VTTTAQGAPSVPMHWTLDYKHLRVGATYVVAKPFRDFDRVERQVGDGFLFLGHNYFAKEEGLTLYVASPTGAFETWRMQCVAEEQAAVNEALAEHLVAGPVAVDQLAFMRALAERIAHDNSATRALGLELVARMPVVTPEVTAAVGAQLTRMMGRTLNIDEVVTLLMALYNVATAAQRPHIEALRDALPVDGGRVIAEAVLRKLDRT
jgi:hypothetical protein